MKFLNNEKKILKKDTKMFTILAIRICIKNKIKLYRYLTRLAKGFDLLLECWTTALYILVYLLIKKYIFDQKLSRDVYMILIYILINKKFEIIKQITVYLRQ